MDGCLAHYVHNIHDFVPDLYLSTKNCILSHLPADDGGSKTASKSRPVMRGVTAQSTSAKGDASLRTGARDPLPHEIPLLPTKDVKAYLRKKKVNHSHCVEK